MIELMGKKSTTDIGVVTRVAYRRKRGDGRDELRFVEAVGVGITDDEEHPYHDRPTVRFRVIRENKQLISESRYVPTAMFARWLRAYDTSIDAHWTAWARDCLAQQREAA